MSEELEHIFSERRDLSTDRIPFLLYSKRLNRFPKGNTNHLNVIRTTNNRTELLLNSKNWKQGYSNLFYNCIVYNRDIFISGHFKHDCSLCRRTTNCLPPSAFLALLRESTRVSWNGVDWDESNSVSRWGESVINWPHLSHNENKFN